MFWLVRAEGRGFTVKKTDRLHQLGKRGVYDTTTIGGGDRGKLCGKGPTRVE